MRYDFLSVRTLGLQHVRRAFLNAIRRGIRRLMKNITNLDLRRVSCQKGIRRWMVMMSLPLPEELQPSVTPALTVRCSRRHRDARRLAFDCVVARLLLVLRLVSAQGLAALLVMALHARHNTTRTAP